MKKVILFGASGNLGKEIGKELIRQGYDVTLVVRSEQKAKLLANLNAAIIKADVCNKATLENMLVGQEIVISALGKSVSPFDNSKAGFKAVDFEGNINVLNEAIRSGIKKFIYISAFHAERYPHLNYFKVHQDFSDSLQKSGIDYSIIKPPALFSAFLDMIEMARKGRLVSLGKGDKKTNPIFEGDLAKITVNSINQPNSIIEAGGKNIYTRKQLLEIIQNEVDNRKRIPTVPTGLVKGMLPLIKLFSKNAFDKVAFFMEVMQQDTIAPPVGTMSFEAYVKQKMQDLKAKSYK